MPPSTPRSHGLDTLRAIAIALVFMYHYEVFVSGRATFGWASDLGWTGVDLFFVLSGYLIANQLFSGLARGQVFSLKAFYARRALRTLPAFWAVLALYFLWPQAFGGRTPPPLWRFLTFTQNWQLPAGTAFSHAWSLCVEEQFYLVLPLLLLAGWRLRWNRWAGWALMVMLLALAVASRALLWPHYGPESASGPQGYMANIYYATLCRFDEFLPGVAVAMLRHFHPQAWRALMERGRGVFFAGLAAVAVMAWLLKTGYYIEGFGWGFAMTAFGYSGVAMAYALLVVAAVSPRTPLARWKVPGAAPVALASYSFYLVHKPVAYFVQQHWLKPMGAGPGWTLAAVTLACVAAGGLLYRLVEAPGLALRDRWVRPLFARGRAEKSSILEPAALPRASAAGQSAP